MLQLRLSVLLLLLCSCRCAFAVTADPCPRPAVASTIAEPEDLRSHNGILRVELDYRTSTDAQGQTRFCFLSKDGAQSPNLRVNPGDELILTLKNDLPPAPDKLPVVVHAMPMAGQCTAGGMTASSTNLHFHGLVIAPVCHQDDTLTTSIQPSDPPFEYRFKIPEDQPPGVYWYHPHIHGFAKAQILGGASGALIVEGIEKLVPEVAGLPERVLVVRDQNLLNPGAEPVHSDSVPPPIVLRDAEGDILNTGTGLGKPAKDLSLNFVPIPFPTYQPAVITMRPSEKQLWRVLNASAITYLDVQVLFKDSAQPLGLVALDGTPLNYGNSEGHNVLWKSHILLPPAGRAEFILKGPPPAVAAAFVTRSVDTGPAGENDPTRPLATIRVSPDAAEPASRLGSPVPQPAAAQPLPLGQVKPVRNRLLYFSEVSQDPKDPNSPTVFFVTVDGQTPKAFDPNSPLPNITVRSGDVEDWTIENRSTELHAFHIHQTHFQLLLWNGVPVDEPFLRDTINVPYWDGKSPVYPSVKLRMDFRDPNIVGTFAYHCHLLEHQDGGMMGIIRVEPRNSVASGKK